MLGAPCCGARSSGRRASTARRRRGRRRRRATRRPLRGRAHARPRGRPRLLPARRGLLLRRLILGRARASSRRTAARWPPTSTRCERLRALDLELLCPGHGPWITDPAAKIAEYIEHRLDARAPAAGGARARRALARRAARRGLGRRPEQLRPAAAVAMQAHLEKLEAEGRLPTASRPTSSSAAARIDVGDVIDAGALTKRLGARGRGVRGARRDRGCGRSGGSSSAGRCRRHEGELRVDGLERPVEIRRDRWGVPHIRAQTSDDLWFGQGFCHGQDRLWQLDLYRRVACRPARRDRRRRRACRSTASCARSGLRRAALSARRPSSSPSSARALDAYCAGVNAAAAAAGARRPSSSSCASASSPGGPADTLTADQAARASASRPTGSASCCAPTWPASWAPSWRRGSIPATRRATRSCSSPGDGWSGDGLGLAEQIGAPARGDRASRSRRPAPTTGPSAGERSATGGAAARRRPAPAAEHAGHHLPGRRSSSADRFCRGASLPGPARRSSWARTTTSPGRSPT